MLLVNLGLWITLGVIVLLIIILISFVVKTYNKMVKGRNKCKDAFAQIDVQLTRRFDLIPNLVETIKGYAKHEESILEEFAKARGAYQQAVADGNIDDIAKANNTLTSVLTRFMAVTEQYPELKADAHFNDLMRTLKEVEDKIAITRQFYNDTVTTYNTMLQVFPNVLFAGMFKFYEEKLFKASDAERVNPTVKF